MTHKGRKEAACTCILYYAKLEKNVLLQTAVAVTKEKNYEILNFKKEVTLILLWMKYNNKLWIAIVITIMWNQCVFNVFIWILKVHGQCILWPINILMFILNKLWEIYHWKADF